MIKSRSTAALLVAGPAPWAMASRVSGECSVLVVVERDRRVPWWREPDSSVASLRCGDGDTKTSMSVVGFTVYAVACAAMTVWAVLAATMVGVWLRFVHYDVARTHSFGMLRRYGLRGGAWRLLKGLVRRRPEMGNAARTTILVISVPMVGFIGSAFLFYAIGLLIPAGRMPDELGAQLSRTVSATGTLGAVVGTYLWLRGLSYIARPHAERRGRLPRLVVPIDVSRRGRDRLAVNAYWNAKIGSAVFFAAVYPFVVVGAVTAFALLQPPAASTSADTTTPPLVALGLLVLLVGPAMVPAFAAGARLERRFAAWRAAVEVCSLLLPATPREDDHKIDFPDLIPDLQGKRREDLARTSELLVEAAGQLDARQPRGFAPHPTATLLRGAADMIRRFLRGPHAYDLALPDDLVDTLRLTLVVLAGPRDPGVYRRLAVRVSAFDDAGNPSVELFVKPPGRLAVLYGRATASAARTAALVAALAGLAVPFIAAALVLLGKMDLERFISLLK
jgi:hypothetical protein